jgi:hypothetical protein
MCAVAMLVVFRALCKITTFQLNPLEGNVVRVDSGVEHSNYNSRSGKGAGMRTDRFDSPSISRSRGCYLGTSDRCDQLQWHRGSDYLDFRVTLQIGYFRRGHLDLFKNRLTKVR